MRPTIYAIVFFLLTVLSVSTPATAQIPETPVVVMIPEETPSGIRLHVAVTGGCTGLLVTSVIGIPGVPDLDLSDMKSGESRRFETGKFLYPGEHLLRLVPNQSLPTGDCKFPSGSLYPVSYPTKFVVGNGQFSDRDPHIPTRDSGKPHSIVFSEKGPIPNLEAIAVLPAGPTRIYILQFFPNASSSIEQFVHKGNSPGFSYGTVVVPRGRMTAQMSIFFYMVAGETATAGFIHRP